MTGSRFVDGSGEYRPPLARRIGIIWFARIVSLLTRQRVTDTTSGFQALNRKGIALFAGDYPNDYPEVEATVLVFKHRLRLAEVPVHDARARDGPVVDHVHPLDLLRAQGDPGAVHRDGAQVRRAERGGDELVTPVKISIAAAIASLLLILIVLELIRGRRLKERYALLWLVTGIVLLVLSAWRGGLNTIAGWFGVETYPPAILFAVATLFIIIVLLHYSTVLSQLDDQNTVLAQRLALLEEEVRSSAATGSKPRAKPGTTPEER